MPPKEFPNGELYFMNPSTGEFEKVADISSIELTATEDDRINENVIDPNENKWFSDGETFEFTLKNNVVDSTAREIE